MRKEADGTLYIFCDGTDHNLSKSCISDFFQNMAATNLKIQSNKKNVLKARLVAEKSGEDTENYYKLYLPGPGSSSGEDYKCPGEYSSVLNTEKSTVQRAVEKSRKKKHRKYRKCTELRLAKLDTGVKPIPDHKDMKATTKTTKKKPVQKPVRDSLSFADHFYGTNFYTIGGPVRRFVAGSVLGMGQEENLIQALTIIANKNPKKIVIVGWSRGATNAIRIANKLDELEIETPLHLFLIDPVAGFEEGITDQNTRILPKNVEHCRILLATGNECKEYHPQDKKRMHIEARKVEFLPVSGTHSKVAGRHDEYDIPSQITQELFREFISEVEGENREKTLFPKGKTLLQRITDENFEESKEQADEQLKEKFLKKAFIKCYAETQINSKKYRRRVSPFSVFTKEPRPFMHQLSEYTQYPTIFVNEHHRKLFEECYPAMYDEIEKRYNKEGMLEYEKYLKEHKLERKPTPESIEQIIARIWNVPYTDIYSTKVIISALALRDFDLEIDQIPNDSIHKSYKQSLLELRQAAQTEICDKLGSDLTRSCPILYEKTDTGPIIMPNFTISLDQLPLLSICKKAAEMNKKLISTDPPAEKWEAIQKFSEDECCSRSKIAKKIVACAAALFAGLVVGTVLSPLSLYKWKGFRLAKEVFYATYDCFFFDNDIARHAAKAIRAQPKIPARKKIPSTQNGARGDIQPGAENRQPSSIRYAVNSRP